MKLAKDAKIITADGEEIGNLNRFVLDPRTRHVTHIVFEQGLLSRKELVLPMVLVDRVENDNIFLKELTFDLDDLPPFEEDHYVITNERALTDDTNLDTTPDTPGYYYYPGTNLNFMGPGFLPDTSTRSYNPPNYGPSSLNPIPVSGSDEKSFRKEVDQNIPNNTMALDEGAKVFSNDSKHVGDVEKLFLSDKNTITHILITKGMFFKERKVVPTDWISHIFEKEVHLAVEGELLETLPDYKEQEG